MTDRRKPTAGIWITVALVAVLVGYPLSFGPACWLLWNIGMSDRATERVALPYVPMLWAVDSYMVARTAVERYQSLWIDSSHDSANPHFWGR